MARAPAPVLKAIPLVLAAGFAAAAVPHPTIAFSALLAIIFVYVVFDNIAYGFAALALLSYFYILPASGSLSIAKAVGLVLAIAWLARVATAGQAHTIRDFFRAHARTALAILAFLVWSAVTLLWAKSEGDGVSAIERYALNALLIPIAYSTIHRRRDLYLAIAAILLGTTIAVCYGILQPPNAEATVFESARATGTIGDPNEFAAFVLVGVALAMGVTLARDRPPLFRLIAAAIVPLGAAGVFLSLSRGGLVSMAAMLVAGIFVGGRWRRMFAVISVAMLVFGAGYFLVLASPRARERITHVESGSGRLDLWTVAERMVEAHPFTGVGVGNFQAASPEYALQKGLITRGDLIFIEPKVTHNTYLEILAEMGIPGLVLFLTIVGSSLLAALKAAALWQASGERSMEALTRSVLLGLVGMLVADIFLSDMYTKLLWVMIALCFALLALARLGEQGYG